MPAHRFDDAPEFYSVQEIADELNVTRQRANRIEISAVRKLWNHRLWLAYVKHNRLDRETK